MTEPKSALSKRSAPAHSIVVIDGKRYEQARITQHDDRPAQYETTKSRGIPPQQINLPKLPAVLPLTLAAVIAISFLVAASMFSISLTAYSNSVERTNQPRSFIRVE